MLKNLIAPVTGIIVMTSVGVVVDTTIKMIVPPGLSAVASFGVRIGSSLVGGLIGTKIADIAVKNVTSVMETIESTEIEVETEQVEN